jgi:hypothetical protein
MATVHGVVQKETNGTPLLGSSQPLSTAALRELTGQLGGSQNLQILRSFEEQASQRHWLVESSLKLNTY